MIKDDELILVRNRNNGWTGYTLPDSNVRRSFAPEEEKKIPYGELRSLQYAPGGDYILKNLLIVENKFALEQLNMTVEPEYFYTEKDIRDILFKSDNMDAFLDFLDYATDGAIEIATNIAVKERIPDSRKREALSKKSGLNIDNDIKVNEIMDAEDEKKDEEKPKERRVKIEESDKPKRRTEAPKVEPTSTGSGSKYKIVSVKE